MKSLLRYFQLCISFGYRRWTYKVEFKLFGKVWSSSAINQSLNVLLWDVYSNSKVKLCFVKIQRIQEMWHWSSNTDVCRFFKFLSLEDRLCHKGLKHSFYWRLRRLKSIFIINNPKDIRSAAARPVLLAVTAAQQLKIKQRSQFFITLLFA